MGANQSKMLPKVSTGTVEKKNVRGRGRKQGKHVNPDVVADRGYPGKLGPKDEPKGQGILDEGGVKENDTMYSPKGDIGPRGASCLDSEYEEPRPLGTPGTSVEKEEKVSTGTIGKKNVRGSEAKQKMMSPLRWIDRCRVMALEHGLQQSGRTSLAFIILIFFRGDLDNLEHELRHILGSNTRYGNTFDNEEQRKLREDHFSKFDINLLFKVLQIGCSLAPRSDDHWRAPRGNECWTYVINGTETLEFLIALIKNMRNSLSHNYDIIPNIEEHFGKLQQLLMAMMTASEERAVKLEKEVSIEEKEATVGKIEGILTDAMSFQ